MSFCNQILDGKRTLKYGVESMTNTRDK